jgi:4-phospho-D-threonate 3-dehydrogenase / 4-phospho-D-erythronate 3-dehydrogenase
MGEEGMARKKPVIGITMGDPSGIGPEVAVKVLAKKETYKICKPLIVGDSSAIRDALRFTHLKLKINPIANVKEAKFRFGAIDVYDLKNVNMAELQYGKVSAMAGNAAFEAIKKVIKLAQAREIDATVTGPINKEALNLAGHHFAGHTEIYADLTNTKDVTMLLAHENMRVVHVSTHLSLREACDKVKKERVVKVIKLAYDACRKIGIKDPRIGVAGLNPHAGENGMFGKEEINEITPAINEARALGMNAEGPVPPDTLFSKAKGGLYDVVVAMYHDQGHIALKVVGFNWNQKKKKWDSVSGVNITLGLPIIRTSVDHGTAFDIAGKGTASELSLIHAIEYAVKMAVN